MHTHFSGVEFGPALLAAGITTARDCGGERGYLVAQRGAIDVTTETAQKAVQFFKDHHTVVDPTAGWGEMAGHSKEVDVATFEPGIAKAPFVLDAKFRGMGGATTADQMRTRTAQTLAV